MKIKGLGPTGGSLFLYRMPPRIFDLSMRDRRCARFDVGVNFVFKPVVHRVDSSLYLVSSSGVNLFR